MIEKDVVIIGAGVAGLYLSRLLEKKGINYITFERNVKVGKYGNRIISNAAFKKLELSKDVIIEEIKEINFVSPSGIKISKTSKEPRGYVTNLGFLENEILSTLKDKSKIIFNHSVEDIDLNEGLLKVNNYEIKSKIIIFASGILQSYLSNKIMVDKPKVVFCYVNEIEGKDRITTILDNEKGHGFYAWIIPLKDHIEVGFGTDQIDTLKGKDLNEVLFSIRYIDKYKGNKKLKKLGGFIPTSLVEKRCDKNWILIGDTSGGEALMGGSIHKSIDEALLASEIIESFINNKISSLEGYDKLWEESIGRGFYEQEKIREVLDHSSNKEIDEVFRIVQGGIIEGEGLINNLFKNIILNLIEIKKSKKKEKINES